jgi:hypothetical protein
MTSLALQLFKNSINTQEKLRLNLHSLSVSELLEYREKTLNSTLSVQSIMGASFNQFRNHIWGPFLRDMVNISLREQFIHK